MEYDFAHRAGQAFPHDKPETWTDEMRFRFGVFINMPTALAADAVRAAAVNPAAG